MNRYVLGFAITIEKKILLIKKLRPKWQYGCLNGIGGKIEDGETPITAMQREADEEAGLGWLPWRSCGYMYRKNNDPFECCIFSAFSKSVFKFQQLEDEMLGFYSLKEVLEQPHIINLEYIIPFILCNENNILTLEYT